MTSQPKTYCGLPVVAVVGRPNVGKSTLFNRLVRGRMAIVDDQAGVTRDRNYRETEWAGKHFFIVDTGGLVPGSRDKIESLVYRQVETAISEAATVVFVVDGMSGVTALDRDIADLLRKKAARFILVVNKIDSKKAASQAAEFYELGLGDFVAVSAEHGTNTADLLDAIAADLPTVDSEHEIKASIAVVGKPNVGKSSLINKLTGGETMIVHDAPGTTRDCVDSFLETRRGLVRLVDTAGLRRKSRAGTNLEKYANVRSIAAIERCDVAALLLDATGDVTKQDLAIAAHVEKSGKGLMLAWNKWDLKKPDEKRAFLEKVRTRFRRAPYLPVVFISSLTGAGLDNLLGKCLSIHEDLDSRIPTGVLNRMIAPASGKSPSGRPSGLPRIYYAAQTGVRPPAFTLFVNDPSLFSEAYRRHVEKTIRSVHPFEGIPVRIRVRQSK